MRHTILLGLIAWGLLAVAPIADPGPAGGQANDARHEKATFASGCFWCMEPPFDELPGVISTTSGYTGGRTKNPTYEEVSSGATGHAEAVEVVFDPTKITYARLLDVFWKNIDPITPNQQFCDVGSQYRSAIYYHNEEQKRLAEGSKKTLESSGRFQQPIVTEIAAASHFYRAEEYHQDYYKKNPIRFNLYKYRCGRARRLEQLCGTSPSQSPAGAAAEHLNVSGASDMRVSAVHAGGSQSCARLLATTKAAAAPAVLPSSSSMPRSWLDFGGSQQRRVLARVSTWSHRHNLNAGRAYDILGRDSRVHLTRALSSDDRLTTTWNSAPVWGPLVGSSVASPTKRPSSEATHHPSVALV